MTAQRTHASLATERASVLQDVLPYLFKDGYAPPPSLIRKVALHLAISEKPDLLQNPKKVKGDVHKIYEKYGADVEIFHDDFNERQTTCPLTRSTVNVPWVGVCGHVFEECAILDYIEKKDLCSSGKNRTRKGSGGSSVVCPVVGCDKVLVRKSE